MIFKKGTSYEGDHVINSLEQVDRLVFDRDNEKCRIVINYWKGVESAPDSQYIAIGLIYRSSLDLANAIRGNELFYDLYDDPEDLDEVVDFCSWSIIELKEDE